MSLARQNAPTRQSHEVASLGTSLSLILILLVAGCLDSGTSVCASGVICPANSRCSADGLQCLGPAADCGDGLVEPAQEDCDDGTLNSDSSGDACRLNCTAPVCGDGVLDPKGNDRIAETADDEVCDDGNNFNVDPITGEPDGCSSDCLSVQLCGNGTVEPFNDEACDDANSSDRDGCGSSCQRIDRVWRDRGAGSPRSQHAVAYDAARGRIVLFGGADPQVLGDTWEWDGDAWTNMTPPSPSDSPPARKGHSMAFDTSSNKVILFGGQGAVTPFYDTWQWDGVRWQEVTPVFSTDSPTPRVEHSMAYDSARSRVVLFGGAAESGGLSLGDTWEWDGASWNEVTPVGPSPSPRPSAFLIYDPVRGRTILYGGGANLTNFSDTWEWDGANWTDVTPALPADSPPERRNHAMAFDASSGQIVLFGGQGFGDTWLWDGLRWTQALPANSPPARLNHTMTFDALRGHVVLTGGVNITRFGDTWKWSNGEWTEVTPLASSNPPPRHNHSMAFDQARGRLVLFGGLDFTTLTFFADTWEWDGSAWLERTPVLAANSPSARFGTSMAYDAARRKIVLFGGNEGSNNAADTWEWDGTLWTEVSPPQPIDSPSARTGHAMSMSDSELLLFGGFDGTDLGDTWLWNGATWTEVSPIVAAESPSARRNHGMAFDVSRNRVVLQGGFNKGDTWEWSNGAWVDSTPAFLVDSPAQQANTLMAYDSDRARVVVVSPDSEVREWDGSKWIVISPSTPFPAQLPLGVSALAYDAIAGARFLFGGTSGGVTRADSLRLTSPLAGHAACLTGFDDDGDGVIGCEDDDCWSRCTPHCPPQSTASWPDDCDDTSPRCGDGTCNTLLETCRLCPSDCGVCAPICGNYHCEAGENSGSCPGDCL